MFGYRQVLNVVERMIEIELFCPRPGQYLSQNHPFYPHTIRRDLKRLILSGINISYL